MPFRADPIKDLTGAQFEKLYMEGLKQAQVIAPTVTQYGQPEQQAICCRFHNLPPLF
jgi:hypothetical protein